MPTLQVRDLPQDLYDKLAAEAAIEFRSLAQQTTFILDQHFRERAERMRLQVVRHDDNSPQAAAERIVRRKRIFAQLETMPKVTIPENFPSVVDMLAEDREERDGRFGL